MNKLHTFMRQEAGREERERVLDVLGGPEFSIYGDFGKPMEADELRTALEPKG